MHERLQYGLRSQPILGSTNHMGTQARGCLPLDEAKFTARTTLLILGACLRPSGRSRCCFWTGILRTCGRRERCRKETHHCRAKAQRCGSLSEVSSANFTTAVPIGKCSNWRFHRHVLLPTFSVE